MNKKSLHAFFMIITICFCTTSCRDNAEIITPVEPITNLIRIEDEENYHVNRLNDKESPYTIWFENKDGTKSLYIFNSPISFYENNSLRDFDTRLVAITDSEMKKRGYSLEPYCCDIKSYFPKNLQNNPFIIKSQNDVFSFTPEAELIGNNLQKGVFVDLIDREHISAIYKNDNGFKVEYIPTSAGIMANITIKEKPQNNQLIFYIEQQYENSGNINPINKDNQYIIFQDGADNAVKSIIYTSYLYDSVGEISFDNSVQILNENNELKYIITLDENFLNSSDTKYPVTITPTFEIYRASIPDSTIYSNKPNTNIYLANYAMLGNNDYYGDSQHYVRFKINYLFKTFGENIKSAYYITTVLSKSPNDFTIEMLNLKDIWPSPYITWNTKMNTHGSESTKKLYSSGQYKIDVTDFIKACTKDDSSNMESYGLVMAATVEDSIGNKVITTNDNNFYQSYVRIDFFDLPRSIEKIYAIN